MNSALHAFLTPGKNSTISNIIGWFDDEIKALPATIVKVNKNFVCYAIVGVLRMLYDSSSEYLEGLQSVMASWDASTLEDLLPELSKLIGRIVKHMVGRAWPTRGCEWSTKGAGGEHFLHILRCFGILC